MEILLDRHFLLSVHKQWGINNKQLSWGNHVHKLSLKNVIDIDSGNKLIDLQLNNSNDLHETNETRDVS